MATASKRKAVIMSALLIGGALLAYNAYAKSTAGGNLIFYPDKVHSLDVTGSGLLMKIYIRVQNTSNQNFNINSFAGNVYVNGNLVGNAENFATFTVGPNRQVSYPVLIRLSWLGIAQNILEAWQGSVIAVKLKLDALANVDNYQVPVKLFYTVGG